MSGGTKMDMSTFLRNVDEELENTKRRLVKGFLNSQQDYNIDIHHVYKKIAVSCSSQRFQSEIEETLEHTKQLIMGKVIGQDFKRNNFYREKEPLHQILQRTGNEFWATIDELKMNNRKKLSKTICTTTANTVKDSDDKDNELIITPYKKDSELLDKTFMKESILTPKIHKKEQSPIVESDNKDEKIVPKLDSSTQTGIKHQDNKIETTLKKNKKDTIENTTIKIEQAGKVEQIEYGDDFHVCGYAHYLGNVYNSYKYTKEKISTKGQLVEDNSDSKQGVAPSNNNNKGSHIDENQDLNVTEGTSPTADKIQNSKNKARQNAEADKRQNLNVNKILKLFFDNKQILNIEKKQNSKKNEIQNVDKSVNLNVDEKQKNDKKQNVEIDEKESSIIDEDRNSNLFNEQESQNDSKSKNINENDQKHVSEYENSKKEEVESINKDNETGSDNDMSVLELINKKLEQCIQTKDVTNHIVALSSTENKNVELDSNLPSAQSIISKNEPIEKTEESKDFLEYLTESKRIESVSFDDSELSISSISVKECNKQITISETRNTDVDTEEISELYSDPEISISEQETDVKASPELFTEASGNTEDPATLKKLNFSNSLKRAENLQEANDIGLYDNYSKETICSEKLDFTDQEKEHGSSYNKEMKEIHSSVTNVREEPPREEYNTISSRESSDERQSFYERLAELESISSRFSDPEENSISFIEDKTESQSSIAEDVDSDSSDDPIVLKEEFIEGEQIKEIVSEKDLICTESQLSLERPEVPIQTSDVLNVPKDESVQKGENVEVTVKKYLISTESQSSLERPDLPKQNNIIEKSSEIAKEESAELDMNQVPKQKEVAEASLDKIQKERFSQLDLELYSDNEDNKTIKDNTIEYSQNIDKLNLIKVIENETNGLNAVLSERCQSNEHRKENTLQSSDCEHDYDQLSSASSSDENEETFDENVHINANIIKELQNELEKEEHIGFINESDLNTEYNLNLENTENADNEDKENIHRNDKKEDKSDQNESETIEDDTSVQRDTRHSLLEDLLTPEEINALTDEEKDEITRTIEREQQRNAEVCMLSCCKHKRWREYMRHIEILYEHEHEKEEALEVERIQKEREEEERMKYYSYESESSDEEANENFRSSDEETNENFRSRGGKANENLRSMDEEANENTKSSDEEANENTKSRGGKANVNTKTRNEEVDIDTRAGDTESKKCEEDEIEENAELMKQKHNENSFNDICLELRDKLKEAVKINVEHEQENSFVENKKLDRIKNKVQELSERIDRVEDDIKQVWSNEEKSENEEGSKITKVEREYIKLLEIDQLLNEVEDLIQMQMAFHADNKEKLVNCSKEKAANPELMTAPTVNDPQNENAMLPNMIITADPSVSQNENCSTENSANVKLDSISNTKNPQNEDCVIESSNNAEFNSTASAKNPILAKNETLTEKSSFSLTEINRAENLSYNKDTLQSPEYSSPISLPKATDINDIVLNEGVISCESEEITIARMELDEDYFTLHSNLRDEIQDAERRALAGNPPAEESTVITVDQNAMRDGHIVVYDKRLAVGEKATILYKLEDDEDEEVDLEVDSGHDAKEHHLPPVSTDSSNSSNSLDGDNATVDTLEKDRKIFENTIKNDDSPQTNSPSKSVKNLDSDEKLENNENSFLQDKGEKLSELSEIYEKDLETDEDTESESERYSEDDKEDEDHQKINDSDKSNLLDLMKNGNENLKNESETSKEIVCETDIQLRFSDEEEEAEIDGEKEKYSDNYEKTYIDKDLDEIDFESIAPESNNNNSGKDTDKKDSEEEKVDESSDSYEIDSEEYDKLYEKELKEIDDVIILSSDELDYESDEDEVDSSEYEDSSESESSDGDTDTHTELETIYEVDEEEELAAEYEEAEEFEYVVIDMKNEDENKQEYNNGDVCDVKDEEEMDQRSNNEDVIDTNGDKEICDKNSELINALEKSEDVEIISQNEEGNFEELNRMEQLFSEVKQLCKMELKDGCLRKRVEENENDTKTNG